MGAQVEVVVVPFTAHSHLNQLLHLSCLLSSCNIPVHYVSFSKHIRQVKFRFNDINRLEASKIQFHEYPSPISNAGDAAQLPTPRQPPYKATLHLRRPVEALLREIVERARRVIVIHDPLMAYVVQDSASLPNAESYYFNPISAFTTFFDGYQLRGDPFPLEEPEGLPSVEGCYNSDVMSFVAIQSVFLNNRSGTIFNSSRSIEGTYIDLLANDQQVGTKLWAIGPFDVGVVCEKDAPNDRHKCLEWLDKQAPKSVLYVSFGTTTTFTEEQIKELALGLEESKQKFIWVLRERDNQVNIFEGEHKRVELPQGFEERTTDFGMVVRDWAPQLEILVHPSTGGFMSHCGWNSCLESITMGVPIAAWPIQTDQPKNAFLLTDILKVGVVVRKWAQRNELVTSTTIAELVNKLMASKEGEEMRKQAEELGNATRKAMEEGGVSRTELDSFIAHITR